MHINGWIRMTDEQVAAVPQEQLFPAFLAMQKVASLINPGDDVIDLRPNCSPVENQSDIGSCVGNAIVGDLEYLEKQEGLPFVDLSRMFVYYNARLETNSTSTDSGSVISLAMGTLKKMGVCPETTYPYDTSKVFMRPTWEAYREAFAHTIIECYMIGTTGDQHHLDIKAALQARHPVVFGTPVWNEIFNVSSDGKLPMPNTSTQPIGGHALLIVGADFTQRYYIVRNSWGTGWGDLGYCYVPFDYLDAAGAGDFWVATLWK